MEKLQIEQVKEELKQLEGWKVEDDRWLVKRFRFSEFLTGIDFVNQLANLSEEVNHHPFISIEYKVITVKLTSWRAGGITELDMNLIKQYDDIYQKFK
ncbi:pterin-4-alpha-carbinolamine dehydratase [Melghiribacillus thermohalophilus]|uniref:4a-hydroxytetrahydrobiopterin dehydratase n=1 Tax=Melghiribacillus thermohalophilus TaxID=1324956 RepID=A0A4V2V196_9BACI|nr:4a-hydroxytetrahydrobiopterin dehydratase [Melghiribacillus thermohalophilus]TCT20332.1 pterin-4-alpha-carbinolamine dehydratase [Melghiribacillus thermohalophilus]